MTRFSPKELSFGFVILSPEHNIGRVQGTCRSIRNRYPKDTPVVCVVGSDTTKAELDELKEVCPTYRGKKTITSLLNTAMKKGHKGWNILVIEGTVVRPHLDRRFGFWIEDEKDILFPIVVDYNREGYPVRIYDKFNEATLNGVCMHQKTFKDIGDFSENPLEVSKDFWALEAASKGCRFKAVLGTKMC
jgi:hypothetical protein